MTNLKAGALSRRTECAEFPEYTPDFVKLAESYGAKGIRVTKKKKLLLPLRKQRKIQRLLQSLNLSLILKKWCIQ